MSPRVLALKAIVTKSFAVPDLDRPVEGNLARYTAAQKALAENLIEAHRALNELCDMAEQAPVPKPSVRMRRGR